jgi:hypothetical protein
VQVKVTSLRQRLEAHRAKPVCASCHRLMDPIGLALENFDHTGKWRTQDGKTPIDATAQLVDGTKLDGPLALAARTARTVGRVRHGRDGKAADVCAGAPCSTQDMPRSSDRARRVAGPVPLLVARPRHRQEHAISDADQGRQETPAHDVHHQEAPVTRARFLHGIGASVALPLLDSMVRRRRPCADSAATPKNRLACFYVPHGATMDKWTPATEGTGFDFTEILKPLEPFRDRINIVSGLAHPYVAGAGGATCRRGQSHARGRGVSDRRRAERGPGAPRRVGDQVAAQHIGQDTPLPSLELSIEEAVLACEASFSCAYRNSISWQSPTHRCRWRTIRGWCSRSCSATAAPTPSGAAAARSREACSTQ